MFVQLEFLADDDRRAPNEKKLTSCMSTNSSFSPESVLVSCSPSRGFLSPSAVGPGDSHKLRIGRVAVRSLKDDEEGPLESRLSGCPLTLSDDSARERCIIFVRLIALGFSEVRRLCNVCDDRVVLGGMFVTEGVKLGWRLLEDDEAQTLSPQSSKLTTGTVPGSGGEVMHERTASV